MDYLNKIRSTVYSVKATVDSVLPGNPVIREFEPTAQVASAGPSLFWRVYSGHKRSNRQDVCIWILEKKSLEGLSKLERDVLLENLRRGVHQLTRLRHPYVLTVEHPLEESRDSLAFCTEPILGSLANLLGRIDNVSPQLPANISDFKFEDLEIQHGLYTLIQALAFLHDDAKMLHNNICPESVVVTKAGCWKLAGFEFCSFRNNSSGEPFKLIGYKEGLPPFYQPSLNYTAPEIILEGHVDSYADIYSLGVLIFAIFNKGRPPMDHEGSLWKFESAMKELKNRPMTIHVNIPLQLRDDFKMCFALTPELRPEAVQLSKISYLAGEDLKCLIQLEKMCQMSLSEKADFLKTLDGHLQRFSTRLCLFKVLPCLISQLNIADIVPAVFMRILSIAKRVNKPDFVTCVLPTVYHLLKSPDQRVKALLLTDMAFFLQNTPSEGIRQHLLPFLLSTLDVTNPQILELSLKSVPKVVHLIDNETMKNKLLPTLIHLAVEVQVLSVKVNALLCIASMLKSLERWMVIDQLIPALSKIHSREPGVLMVLLGIHKMAFTEPSIGLSKETCARYSLPALLAASVESCLNVSQFEGFMALIKSMIAKIESEQREQLQIDPVQAVPDGKRASDLVDTNDSEQQSTDKRGGARLTLEEKKRIAQEQEKTLQFRSMAPLRPVAAVQPLPDPVLTFPTLNLTAGIVGQHPTAAFNIPRRPTAPTFGKSPSSLDSIDPMMIFGPRQQPNVAKVPMVRPPVVDQKPKQHSADADLKDLLG